MRYLRLLSAVSNLITQLSLLTYEPLAPSVGSDKSVTVKDFFAAFLAVAVEFATVASAQKYYGIYINRFTGICTDEITF